MKLESKLEKLEKRAKLALRCAWCLYVLHDIPPPLKGKPAPKPRTYMNAKCTYCGTAFVVDVTDADDKEREAQKLSYKPEWGATYRDERVHAAGLWVNGRFLVKGWKAGQRTEAADEARRQRMQARHEKDKEAHRARERAEVKERGLKFLQRMHDKEEKEFAPHSFPLAAEIEAIKKPDTLGWIPGTHRNMPHDEKVAHQMLYHIAVMEACERVLWSKVLPETVAVKGELEAVIRQCEAERERKEREAEEEKARREAERERERLERLAASAVPSQPSRASSAQFWPNDNRTDIHPSMRGI